MKIDKLFTILAICTWVFLLASTPIYAETADKVTEIQNSINNISESIDNTKSSTKIDEMRKEINDFIQVLKQCEKDLTKQKNELEQITNNTSSETKKEGTEDSTLLLEESRVNRSLLECKFLHLQSTQVRERLLQRANELKYDTYFKRTPIYWGDRVNVPGFTSIINNKFFLSISLTFLLMVSVSVLAVKLLKLKRTSQILLLTSVALISSYYASRFIGTSLHSLNESIWIILVSTLLPFTLRNRGKGSILASAVSFFLISTGTTFLVLGSSLLDSKIVHLVFYLAVCIGLFIFRFESIKLNNQKTFLFILAISTILELLEYHALAHQLLIWLVATILCINFHHLSRRLLKDLGITLKNTLRKNQIFKEVEGSTPGISWINFTVYISLFCMFLFNLAPSIGLPHSLVDYFQALFISGLNIGTIELNLMNILVATFVFGLSLLASFIIKSKIEAGGDSNEKLSKQSSRTAKAALFWYGAVITSALIALSISGFNVQNLAIIAGAFSVGIGFGLQNIVSNFVSGLILLIERPVKPGDWVVIGNTEGFIKKISIRATQITTFDRADILVPNSELVSNQVTNLMLGDDVGRLKFLVGVSYKSDTKKVASLLMDVIKEHEEVITNDEDCLPSVVLQKFGDSSIDFEVRCFLKDIQKVVSVRSDLLHNIFASFNENDIEIPFPQRDLHLKELPNRDETAFKDKSNKEDKNDE